MPKTDVTIPHRTDSHCTQDDDAWAEFVRQYEGQPRTMPNISDFALANAVFMADRNDLNLIVYQSAAKERIRWLSIEHAKAMTLLGEVAAALATAEADNTSLSDSLTADLEGRIKAHLGGVAWL